VYDFIDARLSESFNLGGRTSLPRSQGVLESLTVLSFRFQIILRELLLPDCNSHVFLLVAEAKSHLGILKEEIKI
jgi:hypothetical protein